MKKQHLSKFHITELSADEYSTISGGIGILARLECFRNFYRSSPARTIAAGLTFLGMARGFGAAAGCVCA